MRRTRGRDIPSGALPARVHRDGSIQRSQLAGDVTGKQVRPGSINGQHLEAQSIRIKHLHPEMLPYPPASSASGAVVVAANDAPSWVKDVAPFVCDHSNDNLTVAEAITYAAGQPVVLSEGTFYFETAGVTVPAGSLLTGSGYGTFIFGPDNAAAVTAGAASVVERIRFSYYNTGAGAVGLAAEDFCTADLLWFEDLADGINLANANTARISRCQFSGMTSYGIDDTGNAARCTITECRFELADGGDNIHLTGGYNMVSRCHFLADDVLIDGDDNQLVGNHFDNGATLTIGATAANTCVASNYVYGGAAAYTDGGTGTQKPTNGNFSNAGLW